MNRFMQTLHLGGARVRTNLEVQPLKQDLEMLIKKKEGQ